MKKDQIRKHTMLIKGFSLHKIHYCKFGGKFIFEIYHKKQHFIDMNVERWRMQKSRKL
jgi:hypothetical protein